MTHSEQSPPDQTNDTQSANTPPTPTGSTICGDRMCASCSFNLYGQQILREHHYNMLVVQCPECGTMASLQEYPAIGRWANRWARTLAALWILFLLGIAAGTTGSLFGISMGSIEVGTQVAADEMFMVYNQWAVENLGEGSQSYAMRWSPLDIRWIDNEFPAYKDNFGDPIKHIDKNIVWVWAGGTVLIFFWGVFWSTVLLGAKRRSVWFVLLAIIGLVFYFSYSATRTGNWTSAHDLTRQQLFWFIQPMTTIVYLTVGAFGVLVGRKLARLIVCMALPPRMRAPLGVLWSRDNLPMPAPNTK